MTTDRTLGHDRRAKPAGLYLALLGILLFNLAVFLQWYDDEQGGTVSGYEGDSLVPFIAYLGLGLGLAMLYALGRAARRQHRGLTLVAMAVGLAAFLQTAASIIDVPGSTQQGNDLTAEIGVYVAMLGAILWSVGSGLFAKEPEGDDERTSVTTHETVATHGTTTAGYGTTGSTQGTVDYPTTPRV